MASTRLRKTFQYPDDHSDDDETPEVMDEEGWLSKTPIQAINVLTHA